MTEKLLQQVHLFFPLSSCYFRRALSSVISKCRLIKDEFQILSFKRRLFVILGLAGLCSFLTFFPNINPAQKAVSSLISPVLPLRPLTGDKLNSGKEVFGFAPHWNLEKLGNVDFETLTTLAYFGVPVTGDGNLDKTDAGYISFKGNKATQLFKKAHSYGTRVVLTLTQMDNSEILSLLDDPDAQTRAIQQATVEVEKRGIDGINVDFEYSGNPGQEYRNKFSKFVENLTLQMHKLNPRSKVSVSVYASAIKEPKVYDIPILAQSADDIFMMAYDFAVASSDVAMPTSPLHGHDSGKYWYDVSTAVNDFLKGMPANKLILGVPWYGYNYLVSKPAIKAETLPYRPWGGLAITQTYQNFIDKVVPTTKGISDIQSGWDLDGEVGWKAYFDEINQTWRMAFIEDVKSLGLKYDFAKQKNLGGVGIWALGFDQGKQDMWQLLRSKFGQKENDGSLAQRLIVNNND